MITKSEIRPGAYYDSVVLMRLQRNLADLEGVDDAGVVMATPANLELLADADLLTSDGKIAKPDDLLIVVRAVKEKDADAAISQVNDLIALRSSHVSTDYRPHSIAAAAKQLPESKWVLISVPGRYAAGVAQEALDLDKHVFLYSDNVSIENELALKIKGREKGLLVMGPDCGTAIINGIGLGFANRVQKGVIGLVGASGTGLQAITSHVHNSGAGISQAIGTGGRDLKSKIGAITAVQGLRLLAEDEETKVIIIVSKPPSSEVVTRLLAVARGIEKPVVINFIGYPPPGRQIGNLHFSTTLSETASMAIDISNTGAMVNIPKYRCRKGYLRGLFAGGTLAYEMMLGLQSVLSPLYSNVPVNPTQKLDDPLNSKAHTIVDLGEDLFTVGRLHPMMDNDLRIRRMNQEAKDKDTGMILLDIVLGEGSHPDPVSELLPVILDIKKKRTDMDFTALVIGTEEDPQGIESQINQLEEGGVKTFRNTVDTVAYVSQVFGAELPELGKSVKVEDLHNPLAAINVGLESFYDSLISQGARAVQVNWRPPASGNKNLMDILAKMR